MKCRLVASMDQLVHCLGKPNGFRLDTNSCSVVTLYCSSSSRNSPKLCSTAIKNSLSSQAERSNRCGLECEDEDK